MRENLSEEYRWKTRDRNECVGSALVLNNAIVTLLHIADYSLPLSYPQNLSTIV
jgi:hypothetical protein